MDPKCYCGAVLTEDSAREHLYSCESFKKHSALHGLYLESQFTLSLFSWELSVVSRLLEEELPKLEKKPSSLFRQKSSLLEDFPPYREDESIQCALCLRLATSMQGMIFLNCAHLICTSHITEKLKTEIAQTSVCACPLPECSYTLSTEEILNVISEKEFEKLRDSSLLQFSAHAELPMATCKCGETTMLEPGPVETSFKDTEGHEISREAAENMAKYRLRCRRCQGNLCVHCKTMPYHTGKTCEEFSHFKASKRCRYCDSVIDSVRPLCSKPDCNSMYSVACKKILACGHQCYGVKNESECLSCLSEDCAGDSIGEHDFCCMCYMDGLGMAPAIQLQCGHMLHYPCILECLAKRWVGPRITFSFARCPVCKSWLESSNPVAQERLTEVKALYEELRGKALSRLKFERLEKDRRLIDPTSEYYANIEKFAMDVLTYYQCFKCEKPYFGGMKDCEQNIDRVNYNQEELVCASCSATGFEGKQCHAHGAENVEFKCRFCCSVAVWFCWGTTHFCDRCHVRQNAGDYMTNKPVDQLPRCSGAETCPLKVAHPPNGGEYALGCALCRELISRDS